MLWGRNSLLCRAGFRAFISMIQFIIFWKMPLFRVTIIVMFPFPISPGNLTFINNVYFNKEINQFVQITQLHVRGIIYKCEKCDESWLWGSEPQGFDIRIKRSKRLTTKIATQFSEICKLTRTNKWRMNQNPQNRWYEMKPPLSKVFIFTVGAAAIKERDKTPNITALKKRKAGFTP